jgi:integrase/recombinase XerD
MSDGARIDRFLEMMAAERGASRNTLAAYRRDLEQAAEWLKGALGDADAAALRKLMADYQSLAASSAARKLSALRQFFAFLLDEGERADNPALDIARPTTRRPLPRILTHEHVDAAVRTGRRRSGGGRAACRGGTDAVCSNFSMDRGFARANWSRCRAGRSRASANI